MAQGLGYPHFKRFIHWISLSYPHKSLLDDKVVIIGQAGILMLTSSLGEQDERYECSGAEVGMPLVSAP